MSSRSRLLPSRAESRARKHAAGREVRGFGAGSRDVQPFEALEARKLFSVSLALSGATAVGEGDYPLGLSLGGSSAGAISAYTINWGDGAVSTVSPTSPQSHNFDGLATPTPYAINAVARGQVVNSTSADLSGSVTDLVVQSDGKTVTVGTVNLSASVSAIEVRRYTDTGASDVSFGIGGRVVVAIPGATSSDGAAVALDSLGRIVVAGKATVGGADEFAVARLSTGGAVDFATHEPVGTNPLVSSVAVLPGGGIVVGGSSTIASSQDFALAGFTSAGATDTGFGTGGVVTTDFGGSETLAAITLHTDGLGNPDGIIAAGSRSLGGGQIVVANYSLAGAAGASVVSDLVPGDIETPSDVVYTGGKTLVSGTIGTGVAPLFLARYTGTTLDAGFGSGGLTTTSAAPNSPLLPHVAVQADGKILVGTTLKGSTNAGFGLFRYGATGTLDAGFGNGGLLLTPTATTGLSGGAVGLLPGGGIVQAGTVQDNTYGGTDGTVLFYATGSLGITVSNVAPTASITAPATAAPYEDLAFSFTVGDASLADATVDDTHQGLTTELNYGDGTDPESFTGVPAITFPGGHAYTHAGTYTVTLKVTDKDGAQTVVTKSVTVARAGLVADPVNGGNMLLVAGPNTGSTADKIQIKAAGAGIQAVVDGVTSPTFTGVDRVVIFGNEGDDDIQVLTNVVAEIYGGPGNDKLKGGGLNDVIVGGAGDDLITGGVARDFLVGDSGADKVIGDSDDDILIGGVCTYVTDDVALIDRRFATAAVMAEWTSGDSYATRVQNLRDGTGLANGYYLSGDGEAATILDDTSEDKLTGDAGQDWFFANKDGPVKDKITDLLGSEFTDEDRSFAA